MLFKLSINGASHLHIYFDPFQIDYSSVVKTFSSLFSFLPLLDDVFLLYALRGVCVFGILYLLLPILIFQSLVHAPTTPLTFSSINFASSIPKTCLDGYYLMFISKKRVLIELWRKKNLYCKTE